MHTYIYTYVYIYIVQCSNRPARPSHRTEQSKPPPRQYHTPITSQGGEVDSITPPPHHTGGGGLLYTYIHAYIPPITNIPNTPPPQATGGRGGTIRSKTEHPSLFGGGMGHGVAKKIVMVQVSKNICKASIKRYLRDQKKLFSFAGAVFWPFDAIFKSCGL